VAAFPPKLSLPPSWPALSKLGNYQLRVQISIQDRMRVRITKNRTRCCPQAGYSHLQDRRLAPTDRCPTAKRSIARRSARKQKMPIFSGFPGFTKRSLFLGRIEEEQYRLNQTTLLVSGCAFAQLLEQQQRMTEQLVSSLQER